MNPPINTNGSSISGALGSEVTVEYLRTGLETTYPPKTPQSTPGPSQITPTSSQNIPPPSLNFQPGSIYLHFSQPLQSKNQTTSTPFQASNITILPLTNSQRFNFVIFPDWVSEIHTTQ